MIDKGLYEVYWERMKEIRLFGELVWWKHKGLT